MDAQTDDATVDDHVVLRSACHSSGDRFGSSIRAQARPGPARYGALVVPVVLARIRRQRSGYAVRLKVPSSCMAVLQLCRPPSDLAHLLRHCGFLDVPSGAFVYSACCHVVGSKNLSDFVNLRGRIHFVRVHCRLRQESISDRSHASHCLLAIPGTGRRRTTLAAGRGRETTEPGTEACDFLTTSKWQTDISEISRLLCFASAFLDDIRP